MKSNALSNVGSLAAFIGFIKPTRQTCGSLKVNPAMRVGFDERFSHLIVAPAGFDVHGFSIKDYRVDAFRVMVQHDKSVIYG